MVLGPRSEGARHRATAAVTTKRSTTSAGAAAILALLVGTALAGSSVPQAEAAGDRTAVSELTPTRAVNGYGPVETDMSNGGRDADDGRTLSIRGRTFSSGLGVHAGSSLDYALGGRFTRFEAVVGIDDETRRGSVVFEVWADGARAFVSPRVTGLSAPLAVGVDIRGAQKLRLVVLGGRDGTRSDHADWGGATLMTSTRGDAVPEPTTTTTTTTPLPSTTTAPAPSTTPTTTAPAPSTTTPAPTTLPAPSNTTTPSSSTTTSLPPAGSASGFPGPDNTGWRHTGVTLRTVKVGDTGPGWSAESVAGSPVLYVRSDGAKLDGLDIPMCVKVMAHDVTISRSRVTCASYYTINVSDPPTYFRGLTLTDLELDGLGSTALPGIAVMASPGATYTRLDVHGFGSSGPRLGTGTTLQDSWIHGFVCAKGEHSAGTSANDGGSNIRVLRNNIDISTGAAGCASNSIALYHDFGSYDGVLIQGNLVNGGAYCIYTAQSLGSKNVRVEGNTFGRLYNPSCGQYGAVTQVKSGNGNTFTGNVWGDGAAATSAHRTGDPLS